jgi:hypothetical protein
MRVPLQVLATIPANFASGNTKLGRTIFSWSLPAALTCPGRSRLCEGLCYALKHRFVMAKLFMQFVQNWIIASTPFFAWWMVRKILKARAGVVRIHVSGDFFNAIYAEQWVKIAEALPLVHFFAYTRSWRDPSIRNVLARLSALPNVQLWYSVDAETGCPTTLATESQVRLAYLATHPQDVCERADLVFRDYPARDVIQKQIGGVLVCPAENGTGRRIQCDKCGICWSDPIRNTAKRAGKRFRKAA